MRRTRLRLIRVFRSPLDRGRGHLVAGALVLPCALGRSGIVHRKREGDGGTPVGRHRVLGGFYRPDRLSPGRAGLRLRPLRPENGWCDEAGDPRYNKPVTLPCAVSHERMWRDDGLYDLVLDLAWNRGPIVPGRGSAIFMHCTRPDFDSTEGCVALRRSDLRRLLPLIGRDTVVAVIG